MKNFLTERDIKERITELYNSSPNIHISISIKRPRLELSDVEAEIKGVYAHLFSIEARDKGFSQIHSVQYSDVLIGKVKILEL